MSACDEELMQALFAALPVGESVDAAGEKQLETAHKYMSELFKRGISSRRFEIETGLTGFPVFPKQPGMHRQSLMSGNTSVYYSFWLTDKNHAVATSATTSTVQFLKKHMGDWASQFTMQLFIDVDSDNAEYPAPIEGLTRFAECMEFNLARASEVFDDIEKACRRVAPHAQHRLRIGIGKFGPEEYKGFSEGSLYSSRIPFDMASEWLMFKNIHRRTSKLRGFWRLAARRRDRLDRA